MARVRHIGCLLVVGALTLVASATAADPFVVVGDQAVPREARSWAAEQIASVVLHGLMGPNIAAFRPDEPLTRGELHEAILALGRPHAVPADPTRLVSMRELDAQLASAAGLLPSARAIRLAARDAALEPTDMLGTETVARLLGLRLNHPQRDEVLERSPKEPATRAEAAYSLAKLRRVTVPAGFDCSGLVWRVFKLEPFDGAPSLATVIKGRTTYVMSGEVGTPRRVAPGSLQPGDVLFFGSKGLQSKPWQIGHSGIYLGNGWFVHSSSGGVTLQPLQGWYATTLAWARRPLAEAGLVA